MLNTKMPEAIVIIMRLQLDIASKALILYWSNSISIPPLIILMFKSKIGLKLSCTLHNFCKDFGVVFGKGR